MCDSLASMEESESVREVISVVVGVFAGSFSPKVLLLRLVSSQHIRTRSEACRVFGVDGDSGGENTRHRC